LCQTGAGLAAACRQEVLLPKEPEAAEYPRPSIAFY